MQTPINGVHIKKDRVYIKKYGVGTNSCEDGIT